VVIPVDLTIAIIYHNHHRHHQPIDGPTAGAHAFLMDYTQGEQAITHHAGPVRVGGLYHNQLLVKLLL
jgi:hypothetical protein